jgi:pimeloyl-ACP methyl ester carboxylesterase
MRECVSVRVPVRGLQYHCRTWGEAGARPLVLLHGFQDVSASWQFTVDALAGRWHVVAPDWRGYGLTDRSGGDAYWYPDFIADLDVLLDHFVPDSPVNLVGHSMGGSIAALYAGVRPERIRRLVNVEGFGTSSRRQDPAPRRLAKWIAGLEPESGQRGYDSFEEFALRLQSENPRLTDERARFLAREWGRETDDGIVRRADPAHKNVNPVPFSVEDTLACWRATTAPVLWIEGAESGLMARLERDPEGYEARMAAVPDLAIERIDGAGHNIHHDQPEALAALVERFLLRT